MKNIRIAREKRGLSQKQVAITLGVSAPAVSDWESGKKTPSSENLLKLSALLDVSIDYLLENEHTKKVPDIENAVEDKDILLATKIIQSLPPEGRKRAIRTVLAACADYPELQPLLDDLEVSDE